jgi:hypothetical protein
MSTDSTELTFIRCPSCKSLVPSASPRCRMCGGGLEAGKKSAESSTIKPGLSRARQHTVNMSSQEAAKAGREQEELLKHSQARTEVEAEVEEELISPEAEGAEDELQADSTDFGDPLGAFLEEVAEDSSDLEELSNIEEKEHSTNGFHLEEENVDSEPTEIPEPVETPSYTRRKSVVEPSVPARVAKPVVRTGLSFAKSKRVETEAEQREAVEPTEKEEASVLKEREVLSESIEKQEPVRSETIETPKLNKKVEAESAALKGRLIGWMVSYADPKGTASELREGKFFVSRSSLKGSDLIIDDNSISTPHALFGVSASAGVKLQDLMSDRGVFVRKKGSDAYQRMLESVKLEHGDWVRFGDVEFQLAIL